MIAGLYDCFKHWAERGTVWVYADTHFGDAELANGVAGRPSDEEHLKIINSKVGRYDTFVLLGDCGNLELAKRIKGYKILLAGNHEPGLSAYKRAVERRIFPTDKYTKEEALAIMKQLYPNCKYSIDENHSFHSPFLFWEVYADNCLFDEVYAGPLVIAEKLILSHEPITGITWAHNLHGHVHSRNHKNDKYHTNCCSDATGYQLLNFNQWMKGGHLAPIESLHRDTIMTATKKSRKRGYKLGEKRKGK